MTRRRIVLLAVLLLVVVVAWRLWHPGTGADTAARPAARAVPVAVATARRGDLPVYVGGIGSVTPLATVTVRSRVDGQLMAVHFTEGQTVHAGDLLAEIDPRPFEVQRAQAQGQLARDQALLANARVDLQRYRTLVAQDSAPTQQRDTQVSLVAQYEAAVKIDQAQVDDASLNLTYARITAPVSGRLGLRLVDPGNMVHATDTGGLVVLTQMQPIAVVFTIPEDALPPVMRALHDGKPLPVEAWDRAQTHLLTTGTLLTVDNSIDPTTGTVRLKAEFPNTDDALFPNQFVNARLRLDVQHDATLVPTAAVQRGTKGTFVYVVGPEQTVSMRPVTVGIGAGDDTSIDQGLEPGETVVVDGAEGLRDGSTVAVKAPHA
ncbi:MAG TPA: MdtA/MuxA family multidrug efflux RND transporter periplasmic adaptor subunit [Candidatus Binatia bacterium]|jgi:multidrug efflux system membrane fusion protein|nr:MdtA/MuxA family multidrug efflux RND transporter periplasmic adaptor subunit [Candidatus Binatia bacterium]